MMIVPPARTIFCRNPNDDCGGKTYQGGGSKEPTEDYCDPGGVATGGGVMDFVFCCGSCAHQDYLEVKCTNAWFGLLKVTPSLCGAWLRCFRNCCKISQAKITIAFNVPRRIFPYSIQ